MFRHLFRNLFRIFFQLFFVNRCPICYEVQSNDNVCSSCFSNLSFLGQGCTKCQEPFEYEIPEINQCQVCIKRDLAFFSTMQCAMKYNNTIKELVLRFKNNQDFALSLLFAKWMIHSRKDIFENAILVPVPLYKKRLAMRGYNQSMLLARAIGRVVGSPVVDLLYRVRDTNSQATKTVKEREENVKNAFAFKAKYKQKKYKPLLDNRHIILIDDVITTGATLFECAKALRLGGVNQEIHLVGLARRLREKQKEKIDLEDELM